MIKSQSVGIEQLVTIPIFRDVPNSTLIYLQSHTNLHLYRQEETIALEGDRLLPKLYILLQGSLRLTRIGTTGKETLLRMLGTGEIFAAPALFGEAISPATITAMLDSQVLTVEREALLDSIRQTPEIAIRILEVYNQRLQQMHQTIHDLISERAIVRLVRLLQYQAAQLGTVVNEKGEQLNLKLSHHQIASSIGITYEECVRLFAQLKDAILYHRGGIITVLDWEMLREIANGTFSN
jgi:CRP/FNR family transcriptional regulator, cyclic AMP receptor protein